jgi:hypothetical protein
MRELPKQKKIEDRAKRWEYVFGEGGKKIPMASWNMVVCCNRMIMDA